MVSHTHVFTPTFLNELRAGMNRIASATLQENRNRNLNREVGLPVTSTNPRDYGLSQISITGFSSLGDESHNPQQSATTIYQLTDTATQVRGRHLIKAGVDLRRTQQNAFRDEMSRGFLSFLGVTGNGLAEMLVGLPSVTGVARLDNHQHLRTYGVYGFVQDIWRVRPDLTLSAGLRYEFNSPSVDAQDRANLYDPVARTLVPVGTGSMPRGGYESDKNNFAPRIGLAWRPGQRKTIVRAGYGLYYDQGSLATGEGLYFSPPYFDFRLYVPYPPLPPVFLSDPFPANFPRLPSSALSYQRDLRTAYTQQWNVSVQQELGGSRVVELAYAGSKGTKLLGARDLNQPRTRPAAAELPAEPVFRGHQCARIARELKLPEPAGALPAELPAGCDGVGLVHVVEVDRRRVELLHELRRRELSAGQPQCSVGAGAFRVRSAASVLAELLVGPAGEGQAARRLADVRRLDVPVGSSVHGGAAVRFG